MTDLPTFERIRGALAEQFGDIAAECLRSKDPPERFVQAIRGLAAEERGGLLLVRGPARSWIANSQSARRRVAGWLSDWRGRPIVEAAAQSVTDGVLLVFQIRHVELVQRDELRLVESAAVEHLDLGAVRRLEALADLDPDAGWRGLSGIELAMLDLKIVGRRGNDVAPTVAGMVVFGLRPHLFLPGMRLHYVDGAGERWLEGNARDLVGTMLDDWELLRGVGGAAMAELVVNAVAHRDWSAEAEEEPVVVERDGDVIEVRNPGRWEPRRGPRNPVLANLLAARDLMTLSGSGRGEVRSWLNRQRARGVTWVGRGGVVRVVVEVAPERVKLVPPAPPAVAPVSVRPQPPATLVPSVTHRQPPMPATPPSPGPVAERGEADELDAVVYRSLEDRQQDVIDLLVGGGQQTRRQLQTALGWSRSTLRKVLEALIVESKVTPSGESARSPFRTYGVGPGPELAGVRTDRKPLDRAR